MNSSRNSKQKKQYKSQLPFSIYVVTDRPQIEIERIVRSAI